MDIKCKPGDSISIGTMIDGAVIVFGPSVVIDHGYDPKQDAYVTQISMEVKIMKPRPSAEGGEDA